MKRTPSNPLLNYTITYSYAPAICWPLIAGKSNDLSLFIPN
ncbi:MAG: hypothetical protein PSX36_09530 [bacterium]|nr:hypothetical protein [bacterium]